MLSISVAMFGVGLLLFGLLKKEDFNTVTETVL